MNINWQKNEKKLKVVIAALIGVMIIVMLFSQSENRLKQSRMLILQHIKASGTGR